MLNPWEILGIEPTSDKILIKMAFAKLVKENPPEKDAGKYQQIREAYQQAVKEAKNLNQETVVQEIVQEEPSFPEFEQIQAKTEQPNSSSISLDEIKKLRDNLFNQKTLSFESLLKAIHIYPKSRSSEEQKQIYKKNAREFEKQKNSGELWDKIRKNIRIVYIILLIILFFLRLGI